MASVYELLGVLFFSFGLNLIPFATPSNIFIASNAALIVESDPFTLGFLVALGSVTAKGIHYIVTFFIGKRLDEKRKQRLDAKWLRVRRWAFLLLFITAASPVPDEPVIVPLGLLKYNPVKFVTAFFLGKLLITVVGAYLGNWSEGILLSVFTQEILVVTSIILTVVITVLMLKIDLSKVAEKILKRKVKIPF